MVIVRGVAVQINEDIINGHFGITPISQDTLPLTYRSFGGSQVELAGILRGNGDNRWDRKHLLKHIELSKDLAILNMFISESLEPVLHISSILVKKVEFLACLLTPASVDIERIIKAEIYNVGDIDIKRKKSRPIPFPCLITKICKDARVPKVVGESQTVQTHIEQKIDTLSQQFYDFKVDQEDEIEDTRMNNADIRQQLGLWTYQRRERCRRPQPPPHSSSDDLGFSATDYMSDYMSVEDLEKGWKGNDPMYKD
ncbi:hypothetical protein Ddye_021207 [Dipteronia dyeriana]|uniref:Putative plant transposon protein domain-containing protein n=1 Tax=Dipteronia dyeriana TaxID=168575 RepID=A0AAD9U1C4_9ROSI|nr:hypothetical protein Ddye_021207 [Dipteronia dyeriana]